MHSIPTCTATSQCLRCHQVHRCCRWSGHRTDCLQGVFTAWLARSCIDLVSCAADNVGDNVGDIAGMGSDLFGSLAESTCAALVVSSVSSLGEHHNWVRSPPPCQPRCLDLRRRHRSPVCGV